jgi:hypothetical protein
MNYIDTTEPYDLHFIIILILIVTTGYILQPEMQNDKTYKQLFIQHADNVILSMMKNGNTNDDLLD